MNQYQHHTWREIQSQPHVWAATLELVQAQANELQAFYTAGGYDSVVYTGCGSPYYLALSAASTFQALSGTATRAVPASEIWLSPKVALPAGGKTLLVVLSRSGETSETLAAVKSFQAAGRGDVVTISCYPGRPLTTLGQINLVLPWAQETSMAQTRAFSAIHLATTALAALWANRADLLDQLTLLPGAGQRLLELSAAPAATLGRDDTINRFYWLGSGPRYGLACELSLKMKEMSISHSEPFHFMEYRHGPRAMAGPGALLIGLVSEENASHELAVLEDMRSQGARILTIGDHDTAIAFHSGILPAARDLLYLPIGQVLAFERALHNGSNPDHPENLAAVVFLPETP